MREPHEVIRHRPPAGKGGEQAVRRRLQNRRMIAQSRGFSDCLVDGRVERDNLPNELTALRPYLQKLRRGRRQRIAKPPSDLGRDGSE